MKRFGSGWTPRFRFLEGRYGVDQLGRFLSIACCAVMLIALLLRRVAPGLSNILISCALAALIWCYSRMLSRNSTRRRIENEKFLSAQMKVEDWFSMRRTCFDQRKEYAFFRCPGCGRTVRVPKGKGKVRITCRQCGERFTRST